MSGDKGLGLDATVFVFWSEEGILAGFRLEPGARGAPGEGGAQLFAAVDASVAVYKCEPGAPHPTPIYMPPAFMSEFLRLLSLAVGGAWRSEPTTRRKLTETAHAWAAKDAASQRNARRN